MSLTEIINARDTADTDRIVVYGPSGAGKTTFAATFPNPILLRVEDGARGVDVPTWPRIFRDLPSVIDATADLIREEHTFRTLIIDSLDWLEPLVWSYTAQQNGKSSIEDWGYQRGYKIYAVQTWDRLLQRLDLLRERKGMRIVLVAHSARVQVKSPDTDAYLQYDLKLEAAARERIREWADELYFLHARIDSVRRIDQAGTVRAARGTGARELVCSDETVCVAKSRRGLDRVIEIGTDPTFAAYHRALQSDAVPQGDFGGGLTDGE